MWLSWEGLRGRFDWGNICTLEQVGYLDRMSFGTMGGVLGSSFQRLYHELFRVRQLYGIIASPQNVELQGVFQDLVKRWIHLRFQYACLSSTPSFQLQRRF